MSSEINILKRERARYREAVFVLFFVVVAMTIVFFVGEKRGKHAILNNPYSLIDPARQLIPQENYIINIQALREYLNSVGKKEGQNISIYYEQLNSGTNISINKDQRFYLASLVKLPTAIMALKKVETGVWNWDTTFQVLPEELDADSGNLYKDKTKDSYTLRQLLEALIIDSDNTAHNILNKNFTTDDFQGIVDEIGLDELFDTSFKGSAKEYSRLLRSLYTSSYLEREDSQKILELMSRTTFTKFLSQGIPDGIIFSHKYGENFEEGIFADSGIVYVPGKPYMLTVLFKEADRTAESENKAMALMKEISEHAYEASK